jgi:flagellar hook-associated protein 3 FlgL
MRISSLQVFSSGLTNMLNAQKETARTQEQVSSGKRILTPSDDPVASTQIMQLNQEGGLRKQYQDNIKSVQNGLEYEDSILDSITNSLMRVRDLTLQANDGANSQADRKSIAQEISVRSQELLDLMNTRDANNEYLFSGFKGSTQPFVDDGNGAVRYMGDEGQRLVQVASSTRIETNDSGKVLFVDVVSARNSFITGASDINKALPPATISAGFVVDQVAFDAFYPNDVIIEFQDSAAVVPNQQNFNVIQRSDGRMLQSNTLFASGSAITVNGVQVTITGSPQEGDSFHVDSSPTLDLLTNVKQLAEGLTKIGDTVTDQPVLQELIAKSLSNIDNAITSVLETRSKLGARLNVIESTENMHQNAHLISQKLLSDLESLDYAEAVSRLSFQSMVLEAAQQSFAKISTLSLFNKL